jgi:hypothetical protein
MNRKEKSLNKSERTFGKYPKTDGRKEGKYPVICARYRRKEKYVCDSPH